MKQKVAPLLISAALALGITSDARAQTPVPTHPTEPVPTNIFTPNQCLSDAEKVLIEDKHGPISTTFTYEHPFYQTNTFEIVLLEGVSLTELQIKEALYQQLTAYSIYAPEQYKRPFDRVYSSSTRNIIIISADESVISRERGFCDQEIVLPANIIINTPSFLPTTDSTEVSSIANFSLALLEMAMDQQAFISPAEITLERSARNRQVNTIFSRAIWMLMLKKMGSEQYLLSHSPLSEDLNNLYEEVGPVEYNGVEIPTFISTVTAEAYGVLLGIYATHITIGGELLSADQLAAAFEIAKDTSTQRGATYFTVDVFLALGTRDGAVYIDVAPNDLVTFAFTLNGLSWGNNIRMPYMDGEAIAVMLSPKSEFTSILFLPAHQEYIFYDGRGNRLYTNNPPINVGPEGLFAFKAQGDQ